MTKKLYMFPMLISAVLSGRIANYLTTDIFLSYENSIFWAAELAIGCSLILIGLILGYKYSSLFFKDNKLTKFKIYSVLIVYSAVVGAGAAWMIEGLTNLVLRKFL